MVYIIFIISICIHELGHIVVSKLINVSLGKCKFGIMGFSISQTNLVNIKNYKKIIIFISGPIFNFLCAFLFVFFKNRFQNEIIYTNLIIGIVNMFPIIPLDGGNSLICILRYKFTMKKAIKTTTLIGKICLVLLTLIYSLAILVVKNIWIMMFLLYMWKIFLKEEKNFEILFKIQNNYDTLKINNI